MFQFYLKVKASRYPTSGPPSPLSEVQKCRPGCSLLVKGHPRFSACSVAPGRIPVSGGSDRPNAVQPYPGTRADPASGRDQTCPKERPRRVSNYSHVANPASWPPPALRTVVSLYFQSPPVIPDHPSHLLLSSNFSSFYISFSSYFFLLRSPMTSFIRSPNRKILNPGYGHQL